MIDEILIKIDLSRKTKLKHDSLICWYFVSKSLNQLLFEDSFNFDLVGTVNVYFRFKDWNKASVKDLITDFELLIYDSLYTLFVGLLNDGSHFCSEYTLSLCTFQQVVEFWHGFHELYTIFQILQSLITFKERNNLLLFPEESTGGYTVNFTVHCILKENSTEDAFSIKRWSLDDTSSHGVDNIEHGRFPNDICIVRDTIGSNGFRSRSARLIKSCKESVNSTDTFELLFKYCVGHLAIGLMICFLPSIILF
mmetsp:Transcript_15501/g.17352  ORF Transcript_15501/g.17352 Transcript_15501/m.17352 type:complete len:252 (+) Transcript_15501:318-1073(+)